MPKANLSISHSCNIQQNVANPFFHPLKSAVLPFFCGWKHGGLSPQGLRPLVNLSPIFFLCFRVFFGHTNEDTFPKHGTLSSFFELKNIWKKQKTTCLVHIHNYWSHPSFTSLNSPRSNGLNLWKPTVGSAPQVPQLFPGFPTPPGSIPIFFEINTIKNKCMTSMHGHISQVFQIYVLLRPVFGTCIKFTCLTPLGSMKLYGKTTWEIHIDMVPFQSGRIGTGSPRKQTTAYSP